MLILLLIFQLVTGLLFGRPVTNAYASQVRDRVIVSVTYTDILPVTVCVNFYDIEDEKLEHIKDFHCFKPSSPVGDFDTWDHMRLDDGNFEVVVTYPSGPIKIYLVTKINT